MEIQAVVALHPQIASPRGLQAVDALIINKEAAR
jgi:hypothetical protein